MKIPRIENLVEKKENCEKETELFLYCLVFIFALVAVAGIFSCFKIGV